MWGGNPIPMGPAPGKGYRYGASQGGTGSRTRDMLSRLLRRAQHSKFYATVTVAPPNGQSTGSPRATIARFRAAPDSASGT